MFRLGWTGVGGDIITRASAHDGEDETRAKDGGVVRWCIGRGERHLRRGCDGTGTPTAASPEVERPRGDDDEQEGITAELR